MKKIKRFQSSGGRNLAILGVVATLIALISTSVSLLIYHNSGDIYLDRSRPGFLPDQEEIETEDGPADEFSFDKSGSLNSEILDDYLENLELELKALDDYSEPFSPGALSDETLGL